MKKTVVPVVLSALILVGVSACNRSNPAATAPQSDSAPTQTTSTGARSQSGDQATSNQANTGSQRREAVRKQIETYLTPDQATQFEAKLKQGEKTRQALSELNLTDTQKAQIQAAFKAGRTKHQETTQQSPQ